MSTHFKQSKHSSSQAMKDESFYKHQSIYVAIIINEQSPDEGRRTSNLYTRSVETHLKNSMSVAS